MTRIGISVLLSLLASLSNRYSAQAAFAAIVLFCLPAEAATVAEFGYVDTLQTTGWATDSGILTVSAIDYVELWPYPAPPAGINGRDLHGFDGDGTAHYVGFSVTPKPNYAINYNDFSISFYDPAATGTGSIYLRSSADAYASNYLSNNTYDGVVGGNHYLSFDLSGISAVQNLTSETFFRVYFTPIGSGTMIRVQNRDPSKSIYDQPLLSTYAISVGGVVQAVPEPSTCAMALAGIACGGVSMWRRRWRA